MKIRPFESMKVVALAAALSLSMIAPVTAQATYSDVKLKAFVTAAMAVDALINEWGPRIRDAESQESADRLRTQANAELVSAVESTGGISLDEYKAINEAARADPGLAERIEKIYRQMAKP